jgi:hypothetical protein
MHSNVRTVRCALAPQPRALGPRQPSRCCAAFVLTGTYDPLTLLTTDACPASYSLLLKTADACKGAAGAASREYGGSGTYAYYPYGCFWHSVTGSVYYNKNATGAANFYAQPLCAGAAHAGARHSFTQLTLGGAPMLRGVRERACGPQVRVHACGSALHRASAWDCAKLRLRTHAHSHERTQARHGTARHVGIRALVRGHIANAQPSSHRTWAVIAPRTLGCARQVRRRQRPRSAPKAVRPHCQPRSAPWCVVRGAA